MKKFIIKFKQDTMNPYVIKNKLRTDNPHLGYLNDTHEQAVTLAHQWDYDDNDIEIIEIEI